MTAGRIVPAWCTGGQLEHETVVSLVGTLRHPRAGQIGEPVAAVGGPRLHVLRNLLVEEFLAGDGEWLWVFDSDMLWPADAPFRLVDAAHPVDRPIIGGLCFGTGRSGGALFPTLFVARGDGHLQVVHDYPKDTVVEVDGTGFAFVLVHRSVLETMRAKFDTVDGGHRDLQPWFVDGQLGGEMVEADLSFMHRARHLGFPVHVHTGVKVGHKKVQILDEDFYDFVRAVEARQREA